MKTLVLYLCMLLLQNSSPTILFWNVENFFDWRNDTTSVSDAEFSSRGERRWTRRRFYTKCNAIAKSIMWIASQEGKFPDIIGLAEVENAFVLKRLLRSTALQKLDYEIVHFDSPDRRGIDVALLYRTSTLELSSSKPCHLYAPEVDIGNADIPVADIGTSAPNAREQPAILPTRDILLATFREAGGDDIAVLVNHHPSKYGGSELSDARRRIAVVRLRALCDSLLAAGIDRIAAVGDFNDTPDNPLYALLDGSMVNLSLPLWRAGRGSIRFEGKWELIDLCFVSLSLADVASAEVLSIPFLLVPDRSGGVKPLRTYSGPRYLGGVSDHCPIFLKL